MIRHAIIQITNREYYSGKAMEWALWARKETEVGYGSQGGAER
jgi:hypothetical protein